MQNFETSCLLYGLTDFDKLKHVCFITRLDELVMFSRSWSQSQGHSKANYLLMLVKKMLLYVECRTAWIARPPRVSWSDW